MRGNVSDSSLIIHDWWNNALSNRGVVARLRRSKSLLEAAMEPSTLQLARRLGAKAEELEDVALISAVLADVRIDQQGISVARALGTPDENPICSPLRLRRLIEAPKGVNQLTAFRRALALLNHQANVQDLSVSLLDWNDLRRNDARRQQWLYDYYHTDNPAEHQTRRHYQ